MDGWNVAQFDMSTETEGRGDVALGQRVGEYAVVIDNVVWKRNRYVWATLFTWDTYLLTSLPALPINLVAGLTGHSAVDVWTARLAILPKFRSVA